MRVCIVVCLPGTVVTLSTSGGREQDGVMASSPWLMCQPRDLRPLPWGRPAGKKGALEGGSASPAFPGAGRSTPVPLPHTESASIASPRPLGLGVLCCSFWVSGKTLLSRPKPNTALPASLCLMALTFQPCSGFSVAKGNSTCSGSPSGIAPSREGPSSPHLHASGAWNHSGQVQALTAQPGP